MKNDKKQEIRNKSKQELTARLNELKKEITKAKMDLSMGTLANVHEIKTLRYEMAFIKTIISQKETK